MASLFILGIFHDAPLRAFVTAVSDAAIDAPESVLFCSATVGRIRFQVALLFAWCATLGTSLHIFRFTSTFGFNLARPGLMTSLR